MKLFARGLFVLTCIYLLYILFITLKFNIYKQLIFKTLFICTNTLIMYSNIMLNKISLLIEI